MMHAHMRVLPLHFCPGRVRPCAQELPVTTPEALGCFYCGKQDQTLLWRCLPPLPCGGARAVQSPKS